MRSNLSRLVAGLVSAAALGALAVPASAQTVGVCAFNGHADVNANAVQWVGGGGNWGFHSQVAVCAGEQNGNAGAETADIAAGTAAGSGTYTSLVCGTSAPGGDARGDTTLTGHPLVGATLSGAGTVDIPFVAGLGVITGTFTATGDATPGRVVGFTAILPNGSPQTGPLPGFGGSANMPDPPPNGNCVTSYAVAGAFAIENLG